jgi:hypothetical protein
LSFKKCICGTQIVFQNTQRKEIDLEKRLIIVGPPFSIIVALIMKYGMFLDDEIDIFLSSKYIGSEMHYEKLKELSLFNNVFYNDSKECYNISNKIHHYFVQARCSLMGCNRLKNCAVYQASYSEIICIHPTQCLTYDIIASQFKRDVKFEIGILDEGYRIYTNLLIKTLQSHRKIRELFLKYRTRGKAKSIVDVIQSMYMFAPNLLQWTPTYEVRKIVVPAFDDNIRLKKDLNNVFHYNDSANDFQYPYIFFENCGYQDTGLNDDFELIRITAECVGKENILVKLHPRTVNNRFSSLGIKTNQDTSIPWEIIVMNMDANDKRTFITVSSAALISYQMLFPEKRYKSIFLHKIVSEEFTGFDDSVKRYFNDFGENNRHTVFLPKTTDEYIQLLKQ